MKLSLVVCRNLEAANEEELLLPGSYTLPVGG